MIFFGDVSPAGILELTTQSSTAIYSRQARQPAACSSTLTGSKPPTHSSQSAYLFAAVYGACAVYLTANGEDHRLNI